jgi:transposase InsO family protein
MFLIMDELVRVVCTATPCRRNASARWAENVLSSYCLCRVAARAVLRVFVCADRPGRSGRPARIPGIVTYPFQTISWDLITDLPKNGNFDSVLTIVDHDCTKAALFFPCNKSVDATGVAAIYAQQVFPHYGIPRKIISDRDPRFTANFAQAVCAQLNIKQNISTAYHPQTDGQSERANARLEQYLRIYGNAEQDDWVELLPMAQYVHNSWINTSTGYTPFDLLIGHTPMVNVSTDVTNVPEVTRRKEWLEQARQRAQAAIRNAQRLIQQQGQRKKGQCHYHGHAVGNKVWLEGANLKLTHPKAKLDAKRYGPFTITKEISPMVFQLALPPQWRIHDVFHASLLTPYKETEEYGENFAQPPPELIEGHEEYEVEQIIDSR